MKVCARVDFFVSGLASQSQHVTKHVTVNLWFEMAGNSTSYILVWVNIWKFHKNHFKTVRGVEEADQKNCKLQTWNTTKKSVEPDFGIYDPLQVMGTTERFH